PPHFYHLLTGSCPSLPVLHRCRFHPSFPTRRSSDLHGFGLRWQREVQYGIEVSEHRPVQYTATVGCSNCHRSLTKHLDKQQERLDRKSTRLNSSHVSSSYAVFFLTQSKSSPAAIRSA